MSKEKFEAGEFTPTSELGQMFPQSFVGRSIEAAKKLDDRAGGNMVATAEMIGGRFTALKEKLEAAPLKIEFDRIIGSGTFGVVLGGKINGKPTADKLAVRVVESVELTDHPTLVNTLVLEALIREKPKEEGLWVSVVPYSPDVPNTPEGNKAIAKAVRILETTGQLDHFRDADPSQFGLLIDPKTSEPFRYDDGTLMTFIRDRNAAFEDPSKFGKANAGNLGNLKDLVEQKSDPQEKRQKEIREAYEEMGPMGRIEALKRVAESGVAQSEVLEQLANDKGFNLCEHMVGTAPPTKMAGASVERAEPDRGRDTKRGK